MTFGEIIAEARKRAGLSQKELASKIRKEDGEPISAQYLNDIEHNRRNPPSEHFIFQFARVLSLPKDHLCLAAGMLPKDMHEKVSSAKPEKVEEAFRFSAKTQE